MVSILTENAVKYCEGGGEILAELDRSSSGKHCFIRVTNDCAKPPEKPERLFDRFYRDDSSRVRDDGEVRTGYGIGLSIARAVCEEHKGRIGCRVGDGKIIFEARFRAKGEEEGPIWICARATKAATSLWYNTSSYWRTWFFTGWGYFM